MVQHEGEELLLLVVVVLKDGSLVAVGSLLSADWLKVDGTLLYLFVVVVASLFGTIEECLQ